MKFVNYYLQSFGFRDWEDYIHSTFNLFYCKYVIEWVSISMLLGTIVTSVEYVFGLKIMAFIGFIILILAEFFTSIKLDQRKTLKKNRVRADISDVKYSYMYRAFLRVSTYLGILFITNSFTYQVDAPDIYNVSMNPYVWIHFVVLSATYVMLLRQLMLNLGSLGNKTAIRLSGWLYGVEKKWLGDHEEKDNKDSDEEI